MNEKDKKIILTTSVVCLLPMVMVAILYSRLPAEVPIHWNYLGEADNSIPKLWVFGLPILLMLLNVFTNTKILSNPKNSGYSKAIAFVGVWGVPAISIIFVPISLLTAMGVGIAVNTVASLIVGAIILICGNYLPKTRRNNVVGLKLPWTLKDDDNWNRTHRLSGFIWTVGGIIMIFSTLIFHKNPSYSFGITIVVIVVISIIPCVYSYMISKKQ